MKPIEDNGKFAQFHGETWTCVKCAFEYNAIHSNTDGSYSCPVCDEAELRAELTLARAVVEAARNVNGEMCEDALDRALAAYDAHVAKKGGDEMQHELDMQRARACESAK